MYDLRRQNWLVFVLGLYLISTPWTLPILLGYTNLARGAVIAHWVAGALIAIIAYLGLLFPKAWHEASKVLMGFWLIVSPWVMSFSGLMAFSYNDVVCGAVLMLLGGLALLSTHPDTGNSNL